MEDLAKSYVNSLEQLKSLFPNMQDDLSLSLVARYPDVNNYRKKKSRRFRSYMER